MFKNSIKYFSNGRLFFILRIALLFITPYVKAQESLGSLIKKDTTDTVIISEIDTLKVKHSPKKAAIMSAALPGLGQIYNRKYWKLPIIYGGLGTLGYFISYNSEQYRFYKKVYLAKIDNDPNTIDEYPQASADGLLQMLNQHRRTRDMLIAGAILVYALNIIDASVDAHLFEFDISDDLSLRFEPFVASDVFTGSAYKSFGFKLRF